MRRLCVDLLLSVMATLRLILYAARLTQAVLQWLSRFTSLATDERVAGWVGEYSCLTLAAQITALPLNLPAQPALMILGELALLGAGSGGR